MYSGKISTQHNTLQHTRTCTCTCRVKTRWYDIACMGIHCTCMEELIESIPSWAFYIGVVGCTLAAINVPIATVGLCIHLYVTPLGARACAAFALSAVAVSAVPVALLLDMKSRVERRCAIDRKLPPREKRNKIDTAN